MYEAMFTAMEPKEFQAWWNDAAPEFIACNFPHFCGESRALLFDMMTPAQRQELRQGDFWTPELAIETYEAWFTGMEPDQFRDIRLAPQQPDIRMAPDDSRR